MALIPNILVISNLQITSPLWAFSITQQHFHVILESNPARAIQRWEEILPDLVVFDLDPASLAIELVTILRDRAIIPILLLTSLRSDEFLLEAYEAGVDECILKPIHVALFQAKIKAWLRRTGRTPVDLLDSLRVENFHLVPAKQFLELEGGDAIHLTKLEFRLLYYLMAHSERIMTTQELCRNMWGDSSEGDVAALKNLVYRLRHKIETKPAHPHYIHTVVGVGYQFTPH